MDLNYLLHRQQVERSREASASCTAARKAHAQLAALYEEAIERRTKGRLLFQSMNQHRAQNWSGELRRIAGVRDSEVTFLPPSEHADVPPRKDLAMN